VSPLEWVLVAIAGAVGAPARYVVDTLVSSRIPRAFPYGTVTVNVSGSLILGLITGAAMYHGFAPSAKLVLGTGFTGAYTTFSTFSYETLSLFEDGDRRGGLINVAVSLVSGTLAAAAGLALATL
jgi:fluoride exporter